MSFSGSHITTGLDISDRKLRLVRLQKRLRSTQLHSFAELDLPEGIIQNGIVTQAPAFVQALRELPKRMVGPHWPIHAVHVGLPEQLSFVAAIPMGNLSKELAFTEAKKAIPLNEDEMYYDTNIVRSARTVGIAAARRDTIDTLLQHCDAAGYDVVGLHTESEAVVNSLLPLPLYRNPATLVADLGTARTSLTVFAQGSIYFTTSYPTIISGTQVLTQPLAAAIQQTLNYTAEHLQSGQVAQLVLCGSGSAIPELDHWLTQTLQLPTAIGNPLERLHQNHISKKLVQPSQFATAIGLALE